MSLLELRQTVYHPYYKKISANVFQHLHLYSTKNCDKIMYIDDGGIVEAGTHDELLAKKGYYYKLYTSQEIS